MQDATGMGEERRLRLHGTLRRAPVLIITKDQDFLPLQVADVTCHASLPVVQCLQADISLRWLEPRHSLLGLLACRHA